MYNNKSRSKKKYYAVREGRKVGVFTRWSEAKQQIERFSGADYKVFESEKEAKAWIERKNLGKGGKCTSRIASPEELEQILKNAYRNR